MKEIHAYKNDDGTYRIEGVGQAYDNGEIRDVVFKAVRAKINIDVLVEPSSRELYTVMVEED